MVTGRRWAIVLPGFGHYERENGKRDMHDVIIDTDILIDVARGVEEDLPA